MNLREKRLSAGLNLESVAQMLERRLKVPISAALILAYESEAIVPTPHIQRILDDLLEPNWGG